MTIDYEKITILDKPRAKHFGELGYLSEEDFKYVVKNAKAGEVAKLQQHIRRRLDERKKKGGR